MTSGDSFPWADFKGIFRGSRTETVVLQLSEETLDFEVEVPSTNTRQTSLVVASSVEMTAFFLVEFVHDDSDDRLGEWNLGDLN